ncbi:hypothetical protein [Halomonas sp. E19]|uniref:hypothetical protein n=1 Tax=Halomonas sp. E19 TaxID=3397247 RepID=UPI0040342BA0
MLITERPGNLYLVDDDEITEVGNLPRIDAEEDQQTAPEGGNQEVCWMSPCTRTTTTTAGSTSPTPAPAMTTR